MLRTAICGAGHWGTRLIESVQGRSGKIRFVAAVTRDPAALKPLGERYGLALTARYADVLADPAIDAVVLATPHSRHAAPPPPRRAPRRRGKPASTCSWRSRSR